MDLPRWQRPRRRRPSYASCARLLMAVSVSIDAPSSGAPSTQVTAPEAAYGPSKRALAVAATRANVSQAQLTAVVMSNCSAATTISNFCTIPPDMSPFGFVCVGSTTAGSCPKTPTVLEIDRSSNVAYAVDASGLAIERVADLNYLEILNLEDNKLTTWPTTSGVQRLNLARNRLSSFEAVGINSGLQELNVSLNLLPSVRLGANSDSLTVLDATNASLVELDLTTGTKLVSVFSAFNKLTAIANITLPNQLRFLDLAHNELADWSLFSPPSGLRTLNASGNSASVFIRGNWSALAPKFETAIFANNNFTTVSGIAWPQTLEYLDLRGNPLKSIEIFKADLPIFQNLRTFLVPDSAMSPPSAACSTRHATATRVAGGVTVCVVDADLSLGDQSSNGPSTIKTPTPSSSPSSPTAWIITGVAVGCFVILLMIVLVRRRHRRQAASSTYKQHRSSSFTASCSQSDTVRQALASLRSSEALMAMHIDTSDVEEIRSISDSKSIGVSLVRVGEHTCVRKRLKHGEERVALRLVDEIKASASLEHARIMRYRGFTATSLAELAIYSEYMANGSLASFLGSASQRPLPWLRLSQPRGHTTISLLDVAIDVAKALVYLQSFDPPVVHGSIRAEHVFLTSQWRAKLAGIGKREDCGNGSVAGLAPEIHTDATSTSTHEANSQRERPYSTASDVFAFGAFLAELESFGDECPADVRSLVASCLEIDPSSRPTAMAIFYRLLQVRKRGLAHARGQGM